MRTNSLAFRLTTSAALVSLVLLLAAGLLLDQLFTAAVVRNFDARLQAVLDGLLANVELTAKGEPTMQGALADTRFRLPLSGWYWQITPAVGSPADGLFSESLLEQRLEPDPRLMINRDSANIAHFALVDSNGTSLRAIEQEYSLYGGTSTFSFLVAGNFDELRAEVAAFRQALVLVLAVLGILLLVAFMLQVRYGLGPLRTMRNELSLVREGQADRLKGAYPEEIEPVAKELNLLIQSNSEIVERARTQVGNLAHALKTPLSVLNNEAQANRGELAAKVLEQTQVMRDQVSLYLDRARRAARAQTLGAATPVEEVLDALARTLTRIHRDRNLSIDVSCPPGVKFRGERQDLEEMVGNLMDNASKWANRRIAVTASPPRADADDGRLWIEIEVADDGPGLKEAQLTTALQRGQRLDETKPGSGLGLNIVTETAAMYNGRVSLDRSPALGGLLAVLRLPALQG